MKIEATLPLPPPPVMDLPPANEADVTYGMGAVLQKIRKARGKTQGEIAVLVGLERTSITNIERGRQKLSIHTLKILADALGMELIVKLEPKS